MGSDRARLSTDPSRKYRTVVQQQGRVSLEADANEATRLAETQLRENVIDIVGPSGTPDDGYKVSALASGGFEVGPGTYYLGGWRVTQAEAQPLGDGPEDLDRPAPNLTEGPHAFALLLTEQEVSATEDRALLEVALGGPDTGQRTRLMQRVVAVTAQDEWCSDGASAIAAALDDEGATLDPRTAAILPRARLRVIPVAPAAPADPCDPPAAGGYLGADNQLIRVSVTAFDSVTRRGRLVWGYDNASTLYRITTSNGRTLTLQSDPIDTEHTPRLNQAVEVLRTRSRLGNGDVIAADAGLVSRVDQSYDPDLRRLRIADTIPAGERGDTNHPLFLRLWEEEVAFIAGDPVELGDTGLAVTIAMDALGGAIVARPFWCFAARPSTPLLVYPRRYLDAGQPPEGPRQWLAALAMGYVDRQSGGSVTDDCRETFLPLTKIKPGCCGITLDPDMQGHRDVIQVALDRLRGMRGTVTLRPGRWRLRKPIKLDASHKGLTLEGCAEGVFLEAADEEDPAFSAGLIVLDDVNEVHLRRLQLQMPVVQWRRDEENRGNAEDDEEIGRFAEVMGRTPASIGVNATGCAQLVIEECQFRFRLKPYEGVFASGLLLRGECWGLTLRRNRFLHDDDYYRFDDDAIRLLFGLTLMPAVPIRAMVRGAAIPAEARVDTLIDDGDIYDNEFAGLTVAILGFCRIGTVRIERNHVHKCEGGIILFEARMAATGVVLGSRLPRLEMLMTIAAAFAADIRSAGREELNLKQAELKRVRTDITRRARDLDNVLYGDRERGERDDLSPLYRILAVLVTATTDSLPTHVHVANNAIDVLGAFDTGDRYNNNGVGRFGEVEAVSSGHGKGGAIGLPALALAFEYDRGNRFQRDPNAGSNGDVLVTSNRLRARYGIAALILLPQRLVFGSNLLRATITEKDTALHIVATPDSPMEIMGNAIDGRMEIEPGERQRQPSNEWYFVNWVF